MAVQILSAAHAADIVSVLGEAFHDYPVMRFVLGSAPNYDRRLHALVHLFVAGRVLRDEPLLGVHDTSGGLIGAAIMSLPGQGEAPLTLVARRESTWAELGNAERQRYEAYGAACQPFAVTDRHHHLNMIGVRRSAGGTGLGRKLLDAVHDLAARDPDSAGVSLATERPANVELYRHFGYRVIGQARVGDGLETWALFRPRD